MTYNRFVEREMQRQGAARHALDRTPRGALSLYAAHRQRYSNQLIGWKNGSREIENWPL